MFNGVIVKWISDDMYFGDFAPSEIDESTATKPIDFQPDISITGAAPRVRCGPQVATGTVNADNSVAYGEYLTGARCLELAPQDSSWAWEH